MYLIYYCSKVEPTRTYWFGAVASGSVAAKTATSQRSRLRTSSLKAAWMSWQRTVHPHVEDPTKAGNFWANRNCTDTNWLPFWMLLTIEWNGLQPSDPVWPKGSQRSHTNHYIIIMMPPMPWPKMSEITSRYLSTIKHMYKFAFSTPLAPKAPGVVFLAALLVLALPVASLGNQAHCSDIVLPPSTCQEGCWTFATEGNDDEWIG